MGGEAVRMDGCAGGDGEQRTPESRSELISAARGVPVLSQAALLAFNLRLDTVSRGSLAPSGRQQSRCLRVEEQGWFQSQASLCGLVFFFATTRRLGNY